MPPCDGYTSLFKLQSQATLLGDAASHTQVDPSARVPYGTVSLFCGSIPGLFLALGTPGRSQPLHSPQCLLDSNESRSRHFPAAPPFARVGAFGWLVPSSQESQFQEEPWVLLVHSPLLQQSMLLAVPPLSDMLKFGGSFHVRQVTRAFREGRLPHFPAGAGERDGWFARQMLCVRCFHSAGCLPQVSAIEQAESASRHTRPRENGGNQQWRVAFPGETSRTWRCAPSKAHHRWSSDDDANIIRQNTGRGKGIPCSRRANTDAQAAWGGTPCRPVAFGAVPLYESQDSAYHRTYHKAAVSFLRTWAKTSTTTGSRQSSIATNKRVPRRRPKPGRPQGRPVPALGVSRPPHGSAPQQLLPWGARVLGLLGPCASPVVYQATILRGAPAHPGCSRLLG